MKPYFAKYLPVDGEIKEGDLYMSNRGDGNVFLYSKSHIGGVGQKVKLFLCSRDIQVSDKVKDINGVEFEITEERVKLLDEKNGHLRTKIFKVIGEISPDARWVKEGDEFLGPEAGEECEVFPLHKHDAVTEEMVFVDKYGEQVETPIYLIKGPCGHFH